MAFEAERPTLSKYHRQDDPVARLEKMRERDRSIDGLPVRPATVLPWKADHAAG
jgi:hypothetical protein